MVSRWTLSWGMAREENLERVFLDTESCHAGQNQEIFMAFYALRVVFRRRLH